MTVDITQFEDYSWMADRLEEVDDSLVTYDPNVDDFLNAQWYGKYKIRAMPIINPRDLLTPYGVHWNVIPGPDNKVQQIGCPKFTWGKTCPVCDAIDAAIGSRKARKEDFTGTDGKGSVLVKKGFLLRVLLLDFEPGEGNDKKPPKFKDLPQVKAMSITPLIAGKIRKLLEDKDFGPRRLLHPKEGLILRIEKDKSINMKWDMNVLGVHAIPDEFLDTSQWVDMAGFLPITTGQEITEMIINNKRGVMPLIVNHTIALPVGNTTTVPPVGNKPSKEDLAKKLDSI